FRLVARNAVGLLNFSYELVMLSVGLGHAVRHEPAPLLLDLSGHLSPTAFQTVPIHFTCSSIVAISRSRAFILERSRATGVPRELRAAKTTRCALATIAIEMPWSVITSGDHGLAVNRSAREQREAARTLRATLDREGEAPYFSRFLSAVSAAPV